MRAMRAAYRESLLRTRECSRWWFKMRQLWCSFLGVTIDAHYPATFACSCRRFPQIKNKRMCSPASFEQAPSNRISWQKSKCASQHQPTSITKHLDFKIFKVLSKKHSGHTLSSFFSGPLKYPRLCTATGSWNATCRNLAGLLWPTCIVLHTYTIYIYIQYIYKWLCVHVFVKCNYIQS